MRMQVILDSSFARPGSAPTRGGKKGEFRDWTNGNQVATKKVFSPILVKFKNTITIEEIKKKDH